MKYTYRPRGVCSTKIELELEDGVVTDVTFTGGCDGNTQGVSALARGMKAEELVERLRGIRCGRKGTSCPDQLAHALEDTMKK